MITLRAYVRSFFGEPLKYYQRTDNTRIASIVQAALQEQKVINLSWYKNIKTLLKLDNLYHMDQISAFKYLHHIRTDNSQHLNYSNPQLNQYKNLNFKPINPMNIKPKLGGVVKILFYFGYKIEILRDDGLKLDRTKQGNH